MKNRILRVARPTDYLNEIKNMYMAGLGFEELFSFRDHDGYNGCIIGHPQQMYHLEFTSQNNHKAGKCPSKDHLLVFYIPDEYEWNNRCKKMTESGFKLVQSYNPYWDNQGKTFEDLDGYRVVLQHSSWD